MGWWIFQNLDLSQAYSLISGFILSLTIISFLIFLLVRSKYHLIILRRGLTFFENSEGKVKKFFFSLVILFAILFLVISYMQYELDASTKADLDKLVVVIEIDDYWNMEEGSPYFKLQGYSMENYRSVTDIIDKYGFVATLGASPHIFIESTRENLNLKDDQEMISYLKGLSSKGYEIAMHGYSHCRNEYYCPKYEEVYFNVLKGKEELEMMFAEEMFTYLPPGNSWTTDQYNNVKDSGFLMIANTHVPVLYFDENVIITPRAYDVVNYWGWQAGDFKHANYTEWVNALGKAKDNLFVLQLHSNTFDNQEKLDDLDSFLSYLEQEKIKVVTYREAYEMITN